MTPSEMESRIVRYGELRPCKTAFIDAHTPGSDQKENFTRSCALYLKNLMNVFIGST